MTADSCRTVDTWCHVLRDAVVVTDAGRITWVPRTGLARTAWVPRTTRVPPAATATRLSESDSGDPCGCA